MITLSQLDPKPVNNYDHLRLFFSSLFHKDKLKIQILLQNIYKLTETNEALKSRVEILEYELYELKIKRDEEEMRKAKQERENKRRQERLKFVIN